MRAAVRVAAAVLERTGGPLTVCEVDLAEPGPGEVLVKLGASGVCHSDQNAIDGKAETRCPTVPWPPPEARATSASAACPSSARARGRRWARAASCTAVKRALAYAIGPFHGERARELVVGRDAATNASIAARNRIRFRR